MSLVSKARKTWYRALTCGVPRVSRSSAELQASGWTSQYGQDWFVHERLGGKRCGVFLDIGAFDGVTLSNTCALEKRFGWTGIAVEPSASAFARLRQNRTCTAVQGCIAAASGTARFLHIEGSAAMLSGIRSLYDPRHLARIEREMRDGGGASREEDVACHTINDLAAAHRLSSIDYLSIDTEGGEFAILDSIDFSLIDVNLITVENNYQETGFRGLLRRSGFRLVARIGCDEVYQHERYLASRALRPTLRRPDAG